ncbi:MAG: Ig-like domain-containing protein [Lachnospiraceae bacterium]
MKNKKWMTAACTAALLGAPLQNLSFLGENYFLESKGSENQEKMEETEGEEKTEILCETERESESETESETESESESESETETESETERISEGETASEEEAVTESEAESTAAEEQQTEQETGPGETEVMTEPGSEVESGTETGSETGSETEVWTEVPESEEITEATEQGSELVTESTTEAVTEPGTEMETEAVTEPGTEMETEMETESETESEPQTECSTEPVETETGTETMTEAETEPPATELPTEAPETEPPETELPTETPETEPPETELPTEVPETEPPETELPTEAPETEPPTTEPSPVPPETEPETEPPRRLIVEQITVNLSGGEKIYDGTSRIPLSVKTRQEGKGNVNLEIHGEAESADAGVWKVRPIAALLGKDAGKFQLELPKGELTVRIKKRPLTIQISDAVKTYGSPFSIQGLEFTEGAPVQVSGFMKDGSPTSEVPTGFELPEIDFDRSVIQTDSPMYQNGERCSYAGALVPSVRGDGMVSGNPTGNYYFDLSLCKKGTITLLEGKNPSYQVEVRNGKGFYDKEGIFWVSKGSVLLARPDKGSGFNQTAFSDAVTENGEWVFSLEQRDRAGNLLANSEKNGFRYRIDDRPPDIKLTGETGVAGNRIFRKNCTFSAEEIRDEESGLDTVEYCILSLENKGKKQSYATYAPGSAICVDQEGTWQVRFRLRDRVGNERKLHSAAVVIDRTDPRISVRGLEEGKSYQKEERFQAVVEDKHLFSEKTVCEVKNQQGKTVLTPGQETAENKQTLSYDFSTGRLADGNYTLCVQAEDQAGNQVKKTVPFRINRSGSAYMLSSAVEQIRKTYYIRSAENLLVTERNRDRLSAKAIVCVKDGSFRVLQEGRDYQTAIRKDGDRWIYQYQVFRKCFLEEGVYTLAFQSVDQAGNQSDSREKSTFLEFCVDKTAPVSYLTGLSEEMEAGRGRVHHTGQRQRETGLYGTLEKWKKALLDDGGERRGGGKAFRRNHRFPDFCRRSGG